MKAPEQPAEERLLIEAAQRDPREFGRLYRDHFDRVYAFLARRAGDRAAAEDLTAEVFQQALARIGSYEWRGVPFAAWLYRIAANALADHFRGRGRERSLPRAEPAAGPAGEEEMAAAERRARLFGLVRRLPPGQRRVIELRFAEEKTLGETAAALGKTEGAVKQLQFRALRTLRARMNGSHG